MTDKTTSQRMKVSRDGRSGPYLSVPIFQVQEVRRILDRYGIRYWVDETAISLDGRPAVVVVNFGRSMNPDHVQTVLDSAV